MIRLHPLSRQNFVSLSRSFMSPVELTETGGRVVGEGGGDKSDDGEKAWSSIFR
jgi:hypothetical protein